MTTRMSSRTKLTALLALLLLALAAAPGVAKAPSRIDLPDGFRPEGIAAGRGANFYVGSIPTGAVWRGNARTGTGDVVVPPREGRAAIGLKLDGRKRLFVAGGPTGSAFVYDARTGEDLKSFRLAPEGGPTFVNDVALTRNTAWFTDSRRPVVYGVATDLGGFRELALTGFEFTPGVNNLNGIVAARGRLIAVQSNTGTLWNIDPATGAAAKIDLGGATLPNGDGLLLERRRLYVVQNRLNKVAVVRLDRGLASGRVVRELTTEGLDVPTTIARVKRSLYVVNARFDTEPGPDVDYWVSRLTRR